MVQRNIKQLFIKAMIKLRQFNLVLRDITMEKIQLSLVNMNGPPKKKMIIIENYINKDIKVIILMIGHLDSLVIIIYGENLKIFK